MYYLKIIFLEQGLISENQKDHLKFYILQRQSECYQNLKYCIHIFIQIKEQINKNLIKTFHMADMRLNRPLGSKEI
jgi:hypothetical protein